MRKFNTKSDNGIRKLKISGIRKVSKFDPHSAHVIKLFIVLNERGFITYDDIDDRGMTAIKDLTEIGERYNEILIINDESTINTFFESIEILEIIILKVKEEITRLGLEDESLF